VGVGRLPRNRRETLGFFHDRVLEMHGPHTPVLVMGDFNGEPFDTSLVTHAGSTRQRDKVVNAQERPRLWNLTWPVMGTGHDREPDGTFYFDNEPNQLDQFLINKKMIINEAPIRALPETVEILRFPGTSETGDYPRPVPYGGMGKPVNPDGYSDHFPIGLIIEENS
jgi:hypothetical protein